MKHEELVDGAKEAIEKVFSDQSVDRRQTRDSLEELVEEINFKLDALKSDENKR